MPTRPNIDFTAIDLADGFVRYDGEAGGVSEKILADDMDRDAGTGARTRILKLDAGAQSPAAHAHDYWEEIYIMSGSMFVADGEGGERRVTAPAYACREPGFMHGPIRTDEPCVMIEFSWYGDRG